MKLLFLAVLLFSVSASAQDELEWGSYSAAATPISLIEALSQGSEFDSWTVEVRGVAFFDSENALLFATADARLMFDTASSIQLDILGDLGRLRLPRGALPSISGRYVVVQGTYQHVPRERRTDRDIVVGTEYGGALFDVSYIRVLGPAATR